MLIFMSIVVLAAAAVFLFNRYYPLHYTDMIYECAETYDLQPELICAVIHAESRFDKSAVSGKGASGLMQISEGTAYWLAPKMGMSGFQYDEIFDPEVNIHMGCYYLNMLEKRYGDMEVALCAYNAGSGTVDGWLSDPAYSDDGRTLKSIPYRETRDYVKKIADSQKVYAALLKYCS